MCTKSRDVFNKCLWPVFTRNSSLNKKNCNHLSPARSILMTPDILLSVGKQFWLISVDRLRPRTSKAITYLLLPYNFHGLENTGSPTKKTVKYKKKFYRLFSRPRSRSLTELTWQITPPTKNGHAPPPIESRKIFHMSILTVSGPDKFSSVESN